MTITIRAATIADYENLCEVLDECDVLHRQKLPAFYRQSPDGQARSREYIAGLLEDPNTALLVAEEPTLAGGGSISGAIMVIARETPPVPILIQRRYAVIDNVVVRAARRGQGVGQALMAAAENWAQLQGAEMVELTVYLFNQSAIRFYEELGYAGLSQRMIKPLRKGKPSP